MFIFGSYHGLVLEAKVKICSFCFLNLVFAWDLLKANPNTICMRSKSFNKIYLYNTFLISYGLSECIGCS
ncbi:hypothetical protein JHK86_038654 [Glycine max]|nr:hypothetical protein JHK86_038654 [Glycine max]